MKVFDLHCDTLSVCLENKAELYENNFQLDIKRGIKNEEYIQTFACFVPDNLRGDAAYDYFLRERSVLTAAIEKHDEITWYNSDKPIKKNHCHAILSIEGGCVIKGDVSLIPKIKNLGVSIFGMVWNGDNELASGIGGSENGLTEIGRAAVRELEKNNIIVDISHLNVRGTDELLEMAEKPPVATHSNSFSICGSRRNLQDYQIKKLIDKQGLCGINFYPAFINNTNECELDEFKPHIDNFLSLGGEDILALGSDFDGASMPHEMQGAEGLYRLYENVVKWYGDAVADKIFFENAKRFIDKNLRIAAE